MRPSQQILFRSTQFVPEPGEDAETNPGVYGRALATWLADQLPSLGYIVERLIAEDFGRLVKLRHTRFRLYVACGSTDSTATEWRVFAAVEGIGLGTLTRKNEKSVVLEKLQKDVETLLRRLPDLHDFRLEVG